MKRFVATLLLVAAIPLAGILVAGPAAASTSQGESIVVNGSFERPVVPHRGSQLLSFQAGQHFGHWKVKRHSVEVLGLRWQAADGVQSVDLSGLDNGSIRQKPFAVAGQTYTLSFALAGNAEGVPLIVRLRVKWEGAIVAELAFDTTGHSPQDMGWTYHSFEVTATTSRPSLEFVSRTHGTRGPALDDVTLVPVEH
jgi:choice-of-anchor C domain-containing protein